MAIHVYVGEEDGDVVVGEIQLRGHVLLQDADSPSGEAGIASRRGATLHPADPEPLEASGGDRRRWPGRFIFRPVVIDTTPLGGGVAAFERAAFIEQSAEAVRMGAGLVRITHADASEWGYRGVVDTAG